MHVKKVTLRHLSVDCPRCLWFEVMGVRPPERPFPTFFQKQERLLQELYRPHRGHSLPDHLTKLHVQGYLARVGHELPYKDRATGITVVGRLDEALVVGGRYRPLDRKVRGSLPSGPVHPASQTQLDTYTLLLDHNGFPTDGKGILVEYYPEHLHEDGSGLTERWIAQVRVLDTDPRRILDRLKTIRSVMDSPSPPDPGPGCRVCEWELARRDPTRVIKVGVRLP
jgi:hypothetical protein